LPRVLHGSLPAAPPTRICLPADALPPAPPLPTFACPALPAWHEQVGSLAQGRFRGWILFLLLAFTTSDSVPCYTFFPLHFMPLDAFLLRFLVRLGCVRLRFGCRVCRTALLHVTPACTPRLFAWTGCRPRHAPPPPLLHTHLHTTPPCNLPFTYLDSSGSVLDNI